MSEARTAGRRNGDPDIIPGTDLHVRPSSGVLLRVVVGWGSWRGTMQSTGWGRGGRVWAHSLSGTAIRSTHTSSTRNGSYSSPEARTSRRRRENRMVTCAGEVDGLDSATADALSISPQSSTSTGVPPEPVFAHIFRRKGWSRPICPYSDIHINNTINNTHQSRQALPALRPPRSS